MIDGSSHIGWTYKNNQIFDAADFPTVAAGLQASQLNGTGAVFSTTLTTVDNRWYEVQGGHTMRVTIVYLSRAWRWEEALPAPLRREIVPGEPAAKRDMSMLRKLGEFAGFPHYSTAR